MAAGRFDEADRLAAGRDAQIGDVRWRDAQASDDMIYVMEFMKNGSIDGLLRKIAERQARLKSAELWRLFHCRRSRAIDLL